MATSPEVFRNVVQSVLNSWTALRLAVEHGMGGFQSKSIALQLVNEITDLFDNNAGIGVEDVSDYLTDFMDTEFQTICEDNSPHEVAAVLLQFHQHCKEGNQELVNLELSKLPKCDIWLTQSQPTQRQNNIQSNTSHFDENNMDTIMETEEVEEEDPEWTQVKSRRKKERVTME